MVRCVSLAYRNLRENEAKKKAEEDAKKRKEEEDEAERKAKEEFEKKKDEWQSNIYDCDDQIFKVCNKLFVKSH